MPCWWAVLFWRVLLINSQINVRSVLCLRQAHKLAAFAPIQQSSSLKQSQHWTLKESPLNLNVELLTGCLESTVKSSVLPLCFNAEHWWPQGQCKKTQCPGHVHPSINSDECEWIHMSVKLPFCAPCSGILKRGRFPIKRVWLMQLSSCTEKQKECNSSTEAHCLFFSVIQQGIYGFPQEQSVNRHLECFVMQLFTAARFEVQQGCNLGKAHFVIVSQSKLWSSTQMRCDFECWERIPF